MNNKKFENINSARRDFLKYISCVGLLGMTGCCSMSRPSPQITTKLPKFAHDLTYLQPTFDSKYVKKANYCIDVHAHFFNASDVNVKGYVAGPVARTLPTELLRVLARKLAGVLQVLAGSIAPSAAAEYNQLITLPTDYDFLSKDARQRREILLELIEKNKEVVTKSLFEEMVRQKVGAIYIQALNEYQIKAGLPKKSDQKFSLELIREAVDTGKRRLEYDQLPEKQQIEASKLDPRGLIEFCYHMLTPRWNSLIRYQHAYTDSLNSFSVDAVFGSLVDFDYWLDCIPQSSRMDQMKLHSLLSSLSGGYMLPIISYNPWTDIKHKDASFQLMKTAIEDYGFIGVKIYPPNGFYPYGNVEIENTTSQRRPNLKLLDQKLEQMFAWCAQERIPVMAHTAQSMGSDAAADEFGGPVGWQALLNKFTGNSLPVINAGHFGGDDSGEFGQNNWTSEFGTIFKSDKGKYFYGDVGYWTELENCVHQDCEALQRIRKALQASDNIADKRIMYGTDWLMSSKEPDWQDYPKKLEQHLDGVLNLDRFFYKNALECFGLNKGGVQRDKIEQIFTAQTNGLPQWLE